MGHDTQGEKVDNIRGREKGREEARRRGWKAMRLKERGRSRGNNRK
jgi:hypothetical protein